MKPLPAVLFIFAFLVLSVTVSAQCTAPGDQEPCDGTVSMTELTDYINLWYGCSSCYPDMFEAIEAYYGISCIPNCTGRVCGPDPVCGGSCGNCDVLYPGENRYCQNGICIEVAGDIYYLDTVNGDDSWEGNSTHPWNTTDKVFNTATYGDTILMRDGNYGAFIHLSDLPIYEGNITEPLPENTQFITFKADTGHTPIITTIRLGQSAAMSYTPYIFEGITVEGPAYQNWQVEIRNCVGIRLRNLTVIGASHEIGRGIYLTRENSYENPRTNNDIKIENCTIHTHSDGMNFRGNNLEITGNDIYNIGANHLFIHGNNILIEGNDLHHTNIYEGSHADGMAFGNVNNATIRKNILRNLSGQGMFFHGSGAYDQKTNIVIENNLIYDVSATDMLFGNGDYITIRNNTVIGPATTGGAFGRVRLGYEPLGHVSVYNNLFIADYEFEESMTTFDYHDYNIYAKDWCCNPGDSEPHSYGYTSYRIALADIPNLFADPANDDYRPLWSYPRFIDNSGNYTHPCNMSSIGSYVGALPCAGTAVCNNNMREAGEACDGTDLAGETCQTRGFGSGTLNCSSNCQSFDTSGCTAAPTGPIMINHTSVDLYDDIPQYYIDEVKKMLLNYPGESHGAGLPNGLLLLEQQDSNYAVEVTWTGQPEAETDQHLRVSKTHWTGSGWATSAGEEDTYTNQAAIDMMNSHFTYVGTTLNNNIDAYAFGWCWDMTWHNDVGGGIDPVYQVRWAGSSVGGPEGDLRWGLDDGDTSLTGNSVNMQDYLDALEDYEQNNPDTTVIYTTGPVDSSGESGYQRYLKHEAIRDWVRNGNGRVLFDYGDIVAHNNAGQLETRTWTDYGGTGHTFPHEHTENDGEDDPFGYGSGHLSNEGYLKIAKAMWVLLARLAGWDGVSSSPPTCTDDTGCTSAGTNFCDGNTPYSCTMGGDGCLDRANQPACGTGYECVAGSGCIPETCQDGSTRSCDTGQPGVCATGTQTCSGETWGSCIQDTSSSPEICTGSLDEDCDGLTDCQDTTDCQPTDPDCIVTFPVDYVSYWRFEGNANDESIYHNDGVFEGGAQIINDAERGQVLGLDGDGDYVQVPAGDGSVFDPGANLFTISAWIKSEANGMIVRVGGDDWYQLILNNTGNPVFEYTTYGPYIVRAGSGLNLADSEWHHVVGVRSETREARIYIDGNYEATGSHTDPYGGIETTSDLFIGSTETPSGYFNGSIDEVMVYNRALNQTEIQQIYDSQK